MVEFDGARNHGWKIRPHLLAWRWLRCDSYPWALPSDSAGGALPRPNLNLSLRLQISGYLLSILLSWKRFHVSPYSSCNLRLFVSWMHLWLLFISYGELIIYGLSFDSAFMAIWRSRVLNFIRWTVLGRKAYPKKDILYTLVSNFCILLFVMLEVAEALWKYVYKASCLISRAFNLAKADGGLLAVMLIKKEKPLAQAIEGRSWIPDWFSQWPDQLLYNS